MLMCKCNCCSKTFEPEERSVYRESWGEYFTCCPWCGGDYGEIQVCPECGAEVSDDYIDEVCPECGEVIF